MSPAPRTNLVRSLAILPFIALIWAYRLTLSSFLGGHCRFHPTCSQYALDAYRERGVLCGSILTAKRIARCHPWGGSGYDPVPAKKGHRE